MRKTLMMTLFFLLTANTVFATPSLLTAFISEYPANREGELDSCATCHMPVIKDFLNNYGIAVRDNRLDFKKFEKIDSDGDGKSNLQEINAQSFPGSQAAYVEYFVFTNKKGNVDFNHEMHVIEDSYLSKGKCSNCHGVGKFPKFFNDNVLARKEAHRICWKCHKTSGSENAPKKCGECHEGVQ